MIGFLSNKAKKSNESLSESVRYATDFADTYHFTEPEQTTYRLRHAINQIDSLDSVDSANHFAELTLRGAMLSSDLRKNKLDSDQYTKWHTNHLQSLGNAKQALKAQIRTPWRDHYDWLGQSLAHSAILRNRQARKSYEQLALTYRVQQHLLNQLSDHDTHPETTKSGYMIESILPTSPQIVNKANRLINHYYSPEVID